MTEPTPRKRKKTGRQIVDSEISITAGEFARYLTQNSGGYKVDLVTVALCHGLYRDFGTYRHEHAAELKAARDGAAKAARINRLREQLAKLEGEPIEPWPTVADPAPEPGPEAEAEDEAEPVVVVDEAEDEFEDFTVDEDDPF